MIGRQTDLKKYFSIENKIKLKPHAPKILGKKLFQRKFDCLEKMFAITAINQFDFVKWLNLKLAASSGNSNDFSKRKGTSWALCRYAMNLRPFLALLYRKNSPE